MTLLKRVPQRGVSWRFGLANLRRRALASSLQIGALALGLTALLLLTVVRGDLLRDWRASLPPDAPNQFLVNVLPDQVDDARAWLGTTIGVEPEFRPMVRGRLVELNGKPLDTTQYETRARRLAEREFNLSWTDRMPEGNRTVAGTFWTTAGTRRRCGHFARGRHRADARREARRPADVRCRRHPRHRTRDEPAQGRLGQLPREFLRVVRAGAARTLPATYIAAFRAPEGNATWLSGLVARYPNILAIDVAEILRQIQGIIDRVARAVEFVFLFTLAGGLLVLQAAIASTQDERKFDAAIVRTLGASQRQLQSAQATEFLLLGALAGLLGAAGATAIGYALAEHVFNIRFTGNPLVWLYGIVGGAVAVTLAGWLGTRSTVNEPPLTVLRQLG